MEEAAPLEKTPKELQVFITCRRIRIFVWRIKFCHPSTQPGMNRP